MQGVLKLLPAQTATPFIVSLNQAPPTAVLEAEAGHVIQDDPATDAVLCEQVEQIKEWLSLTDSEAGQSSSM